MPSGYRCGPRRVPGAVKPVGAIPLPRHDFLAPYKAAASQHAYAPPSPRHQPHGAAAACPPSSRRAPKGRHPLSTLQNRQPGTESSARAPSACKFCCSVLECPPPAPSLCLERFWLLQPEPARETFPSCSSPALLQPQLFQPFPSSSPLPFMITLSYGERSQAQICSSRCSSAAWLPLILLLCLLCGAEQRGCKVGFRTALDLSWHPQLSTPVKPDNGGIWK